MTSATWIDRLYLALHTRDEENAGSEEQVRLFSDGVEVVNFKLSPPPRGKVAILSEYKDAQYSTFSGHALTIGLTGVDPWAPRAAFLWGRVKGTNQFVPLAENLFGRPYGLVSQDVEQGVDRWPLNNLSHLRLTEDDVVHGFVLVMRTGFAPQKQLKPGSILDVIGPVLRDQGVVFDTKGARAVGEAIARSALSSDIPDIPGTAGPIELSIYGYGSPGEMVADRWHRMLLFQTTLSRRGQQEPAMPDESYLAYFPVQLSRKYGHFSFAELRNNSDDPWKPWQIFIFAMGSGSGLSRSRIFAAEDNVDRWIGQNPHLSPTMEAIPALPLHALGSILDE